MSWPHHDDEHEEIHLLRQMLEEAREDNRLLRKILEALSPSLTKVLSSIKIQFGGIMPLGPVTLNVGQNVTATVVGFDQNGAPFTGPIPAPVFAIDNPSIATLDPTSGLTTGVSAGVANATATVISAEGVTLTDTETVTVLALPSVLSSIKISFD